MPFAVYMSACVRDGAYSVPFRGHYFKIGPLAFNRLLSITRLLLGGWMGWGGAGLKSDFNHSWSYLRLQVEFGGACKCMRE